MYLAALFSVASLASALVLPRSTPPLPSQDPFYNQPSNIATYAPGQIINQRFVPFMVSGLLQNDPSLSNLKVSYQYLYRTTDSQGNAVAAVTTLLVPTNGNPQKLLAYQTAYDSANNNCSPSYGLETGANVTETTDIVFILAALDRGWYVVTSDYEGLQADYTAGIQAGQATLDSVRAALNGAATSGLSATARYAMWGYSGGALASEWAAELNPQYAPELKFQGTALGGLTPNVTNVLLTINGGIFSGLSFSSFYGLSKAYPNLATVLQTQLLPNKSTQFYSIANGCISQATSAGAGQDFFSYFQGGRALLTNPTLTSVVAMAGQMGTHGVPTMPLFVYKAVGDEISPVGDTDKLVSSYCAKGATIEYQRNLFGEHISEAVTGSGDAISWVSDRLDGIPVSNQGSCVTENVLETSLDVAAFTGLGSVVIALLQALL